MVYRARDPGDGVGGVLLQASLALNYDLVATDLAPATLEFGFTALGPLVYYQMDFSRLDALGAPWHVLRRLLRRRNRRLALVDRAFAACWGATKAMYYGLLGPMIARRYREFEFQEVPELPADAVYGDDRGAFDSTAARRPCVGRWHIRGSVIGRRTPPRVSHSRTSASSFDSSCWSPPRRRRGPSGPSRAVGYAGPR